MSSIKTLLASQAFHELPFTREEIKKAIEDKSDPNLFWILGGKAGSGKTLVLEQLASLEIYPLHSSRLIDKNVCTQLLFEALLAKELAHTPLRFLVEDKGRKIAHLSIPDKLLRAWDKAPHFIVEAPLEERVSNIFDNHLARLDDTSSQLQYLNQSRERIGDVLYFKLKKLFDAACVEKDAELHKEWIRLMVIEHLDPVYDYYLQHKSPQIAFKGKKDDLISYLKYEVEKISAANREEIRKLENLKEKSSGL